MTVDDQLSGAVRVTLSRDEALVFFDWLVRYTDRDGSEELDSDAERRVLYDLEATLEKELPEVLNDRYRSLLFMAAERIQSG